MDALKLIPEMTRSDPYWVGTFAATIGIAAQAIDQGMPKEARRMLREALADFIASPLPSEELRVTLRGYLT
jgi:hypothetical protein